MARVARRVGDRRMLRADPPLPRRRGHGRRREGRDGRGDAAGLTALAAAGQHHARRPRPRAGAAGPHASSATPTTSGSTWPANGRRRACSTGVTAFVEQRLNLRVNRAKSGVAPATVRGLLGFGFFRRDGQVRVRLDRKAKHRLKARLRQLTSRRWRIAMAVRLAAPQPVPRRLDRLLRAGRDALGVRRARRVAPPTVATGPLEGVEAVRRAAPQPARPRDPRLAGPPVGGQPEGLLAARGLRSAPAGDAEPRTGPTSVWCRSAIASVASGSTGEPPDADPHVRWCGRGRGDPGPSVARLRRRCGRGRRPSRRRRTTPSRSASGRPRAAPCRRLPGSAQGPERPRSTGA